MATNRCTFVRRTDRTWPRLTDAQVAANLTGVRDARTGVVLDAETIRAAMDEYASERRLTHEGRALMARWQEEGDR
jgi:hypothetical protein